MNMGLLNTQCFKKNTVKAAEWARLPRKCARSIHACLGQGVFTGPRGCCAGRIGGSSSAHPGSAEHRAAGGTRLRWLRPEARAEASLAEPSRAGPSLAEPGRAGPPPGESRMLERPPLAPSFASIKGQGARLRGARFSFNYYPPPPPPPSPPSSSSLYPPAPSPPAAAPQAAAGGRRGRAAPPRSRPTAPPSHPPGARRRAEPSRAEPSRAEPG